ncbi:MULTISPECIES: helix-turn-helix domain-containing protein [Actinoalloteichus]|uniref:DNA binding protein with helix-turn-helix domain n=1 Tax=Actinoalloteichus fjordicus TaxID=1612552 RepID=A0AAC9PQN0_9PSEU|nr:MULTISPECIES: helix-turn-helix transcriptional regulator [Actinoalloteichus]APU13193.1 DNA binding protein with helix-turn-helix domain [Actinoalloteichus fjordicus]APU19144.1 DNA binding protein with helix-turn-helix domain [Actinoalloteichus sp. GBA129-24]
MADDTVGDVLRAERLRLRLTLEQAGRLIGFSSSTLSRIEHNLRRLDIEELRAVASRYGIAPSRLGLATVDDQQHIDGSGGHVQRRQFLTAAAGLAVPYAVLARLDDALVALPAARGQVTESTVTASMAVSQALFDRAQYTALVAGLPGLLAAAHELADVHQDSRSQATVAACYNLATHTLTKLGQHQVSRLTADRAMNHARRADSPLALALSARAIGVVLRHEGRPRIAQRVTLGAIGAVQATGLTVPAERAVLTQILCTAAYSAATNGDQDQAVDLIGAAEDAVCGLDRPVIVGGNAVTPAQVQLYKIGVHRAAGDSSQALDAARGLRPEHFATAERRSRLHTDLARAWWMHGRPEQTAAALLAAYHEAPTELTGRPAIRHIGLDLVRRHPHTSGARELRLALRSSV